MTAFYRKASYSTAFYRTHQALIVRPKRDSNGPPPLSAATSSALRHGSRNNRAPPRPDESFPQLRFCQDTSDWTVVRYAVGRRLTKLASLPAPAVGRRLGVSSNLIGRLFSLASETGVRIPTQNLSWPVYVVYGGVSSTLVKASREVGGPSF